MHFGCKRVHFGCKLACRVQMGASGVNIYTIYLARLGRVQNRNKPLMLRVQNEGISCIRAHAKSRPKTPPKLGSQPLYKLPRYKNTPITGVFLPSEIVSKVTTKDGAPDRIRTCRVRNIQNNNASWRAKILPKTLLAILLYAMIYNGV